VLLAGIEQASIAGFQQASTVVVAVVAGICCQIEQIEVDLTGAEEELRAELVSEAGHEERLLQKL